MARVVRSCAAALIAASSIGLAAGCSFGADKAGGKRAGRVVVLTLANPLGDSEELHGFALEVSRLSGGTLRIDVRSRWRYGQVEYENGLIGDVRAGKAELGAAGSRAWDSVGVSRLRAFAAPFLIDSYALEKRVVRSPMITSMLQGLGPLGLVGLGVLPGPMRRPLGIAHPLLAPTDYTGLRMGVQQSRVASATMRALDAKPVWISVRAGIAGLGGIEQHVYAIEGNRFDRLGKYLTANVVFWPRPLVLFANAKAFAALTPTERTILRRAAAADIAPETAVVHGQEQEAVTTLCRADRLRLLSASRRDLAALRRAVEPVYVQLERDPRTRRYLAQIIEVELHPSCKRAARPVLSCAPPDGSAAGRRPGAGARRSGRGRGRSRASAPTRRAAAGGTAFPLPATISLDGAARAGAGATGLESCDIWSSRPQNTQRVVSPGIVSARRV